MNGNVGIALERGLKICIMTYYGANLLYRAGGQEGGHSLDHPPSLVTPPKNSALNHLSAGRSHALAMDRPGCGKGSQL